MNTHHQICFILFQVYSFFTCFSACLVLLLHSQGPAIHPNRWISLSRSLDYSILLFSLPLFPEWVLVTNSTKTNRHIHRLQSCPNTKRRKKTRILTMSIFRGSLKTLQRVVSSNGVPLFRNGNEQTNYQNTNAHDAAKT